MDGLDKLLFVNFGDLSIYQKSISFVEFVTVIRINACLFSLQLHKPNHPDNFETNFEISQSQVKI